MPRWMQKYEAQHAEMLAQKREEELKSFLIGKSKQKPGDLPKVVRTEERV
jgi:hypothetical protein